MESTSEASQDPHIFAVSFGHTKDGAPRIAFMISPASFIETTDDPVPGILLTPAQAREAAYVLLLHAEQIAGGIALPRGPVKFGT